MSQEDFENIEKYLSGLLEGEPLRLFEKRIAEDAEFASVIEEEKVLRDAIEEDGLRNALDDFHNVFENENVTISTTSSSSRVVSLKPWMRYTAAACVAILICWGGFIYLNDEAFGSPDENEQLFATHFKPDPGLPTTMSVSDNYDFFEAMVSYKQGDYPKAISKWEILLKEKPNNDTLNYFLGVAHLANDNEEEAITFLQWASEHPESHFLSDTYYYLGLAYIKTGNMEAALGQLKKSKISKTQKLLQEIEP